MSVLESFHHQIYGPQEGRKWVFLHGLMGFLNNWRKIITSLEGSELCLAFDQRGHGRSIKPEKDYAPADYADDLKNLVDELNWSKFILVGHSMGGRNALNFASRYPEYLTHLIVEDIAPAGDPEGWRYFERLFNAIPTPFKSRTEAREFFHGEFKTKNIPTDSMDMLSAYLYANIEDKKDGTAGWRFSSQAILDSARQAREKDQWEEIRQLKVPTLWIRGENSKDLPHETWQKIINSNVLIQGVEISKAGHWVHADQPLAFTEALKNFVGGF